jgi:hypothetical protein
MKRPLGAGSWIFQSFVVQHIGVYPDIGERPDVGGTPHIVVYPDIGIYHDIGAYPEIWVYIDIGVYSDIGVSPDIGVPKLQSYPYMDIHRGGGPYAGSSGCSKHAEIHNTPWFPGQHANIGPRNHHFYPNGGLLWDV